MEVCKHGHPCGHGEAICSACERDYDRETEAIEAEAEIEAAAKEHYQSAITGTNPRRQAALIRAIRRDFE